MASPARQVASLFVIEKNQPDEEIDHDPDGPLRAFSVRLPEGRLAYIDAMAEAADVSRNVMANELLRVGLSAVLAELPDVVRDDIEQHLIDNLH